jgi:hypothetical protein
MASLPSARRRRDFAIGGQQIARLNTDASARVIEKCGGVRISDALTERGVEWRYLVDIRLFSSDICSVRMGAGGTTTSTSPVATS